MRKENGDGFLPILRFVLSHPENLGRGVAGEHGIAGERDDGRFTTQGGGEFRTLRGC